jgi:hypothetical protein
MGVPGVAVSVVAAGEGVWMYPVVVGFDRERHQFVVVDQVEFV